MRFDVLTLFPESFSGYLSQSILSKAIQRNLVSVHLHNFRDWAYGPHRKVDDRPYGGGPGMVMMVEPVVNAVEEIWAKSNLDSVANPNSADCNQPQQAVMPGDHDGVGERTTCVEIDEQRQLILLSPVGQRLNQPLVEELATKQQLVLLCGRYEGFDQRVIDILHPLEVSIGDYVLNGGEVAAMVVIDAVMRLVPGVLGDEQSGIDDSFSSGNRILEHPQYTRPPEFRGQKVPEILVSGNHQVIKEWREQQSKTVTRRHRRDLLQ